MYPLHTPVTEQAHLLSYQLFCESEVVTHGTLLCLHAHHEISAAQALSFSGELVLCRIVRRAVSSRSLALDGRRQRQYPLHRRKRRSRRETGSARTQRGLSRSGSSPLIGSRFDPRSKFDELAREIRKELHCKSVTPHVVRGSAPDSVRSFSKSTAAPSVFDVTVPKFLYHSKQGWSAQVQASTTIARNNVVSFGSDQRRGRAHRTLRRLASAYENTHAGHRPGPPRAFNSTAITNSGTARPSMRWDSDRRIPRSIARGGISNPVVFLLARPLTLTVGASFEQLDVQIPAKSRFSAPKRPTP